MRQAEPSYLNHHGTGLVLCAFGEGALTYIAVQDFVRGNLFAGLSMMAVVLLILPLVVIEVRRINTARRRLEELMKAPESPEMEATEGEEQD